MKLTWHFEIVREDGETFVYEREDGRPGAVKWGPMPPGTATAFIDERKANLDAAYRKFVEARMPALATSKDTP